MAMVIIMINLHSTMVLFKCDLKEAKSYADEVFTFHYGPIQIKYSFAAV